ncbi:MAG: CRISPR-associated ring nuclease Csm6, partial [Candidatus Sumerlaeia bacterium]|nr:CRISPR-associated ring nuclease Csm6 [Candidatus Sumerlaeia bacterium]
MSTHLLLAVAGHTVATITEAVWALAVQQGIPLAELRLLATRSSRERLEPELRAALQRLQTDYPKAAVPQTVTWRVFRIGKKEPDDIRSSADNEQLSDWILQETREACLDPESTVHASLAGGRKTMSFYLGAAIQLCARPQDRLYHVLVDSAFEVPGFLFPRPKNAADALITARNGETLDTRNAKVELAEVPFLRLQPLIPKESTLSRTFRQLIQLADDTIGSQYADVSLVVPESGKSGSARIQFRFPDKPVLELSYAKIDTTEFLFYSWLLYRSARELPPA